MTHFTPNREELAWAAGFYDGEGCTTGRRDKRRKGSPLLPVMMVTQTAREPLERFQRAVGGLGYVAERPPPKQAHHKQQWEWRVARSEQTMAVIAMLWPFLCGIKKAQAHAIFSEWNGQEHNFGPPSRTKCARGHFMAENVYVWPKTGARRCRACKDMHVRAYNAKRKAAS